LAAADRDRDAADAAKGAPARVVRDKAVLVAVVPDRVAQAKGDRAKGDRVRAVRAAEAVPELADLPMVVPDGAVEMVLARAAALRAAMVVNHRIAAGGSLPAAA